MNKKNTMEIIKINKNVQDTFPNIKVGVILAQGIKQLNTEKTKSTHQNLLEKAEKIKGESKRLESRYVLPWKNVSQTLQIDYKKTPPSHIALLKRAIKQGKIGNINPIINSINYFCLSYNLPIGAHDFDKSGPIQIQKVCEELGFRSLDKNSPKSLVAAGSFAYTDRDNTKIYTKDMVVKQSIETKITQDTRNALITLDDIPNIYSYAELESILKDITIFLEEFYQCKIITTILNKYNQVATTENMLPIKKEGEHFPLKVLPVEKSPQVSTDKDTIEEILTKGVKDIFPSKEHLEKELFSGRKMTLYAGIDPTADFIHMGHMVWLNKLSQFHKLGHRIIILIGGFTAMIGDFDKMQERTQLTKEEVENNFKNYKTQISKIIDLDSKENPILILNNYKWLSSINLENWLEIMAGVTMQHMISHETYKKRITGNLPIRLHEISYPLMQGYDGAFMEVDLEVGGSDQTFNMLTGRIISKNQTGREKLVLTLKLLTDSNGQKMGKTTGNAISFKDSAKDTYGKVMSIDDSSILQAYELLSKKNMKFINAIEQEVKNNPMEQKKELAKHLVETMFSKEEAKEAANYFQRVIQDGKIPENIKTMNKQQLGEKPTIVDILEKTMLAESRSEAKRTIKAGGVLLNEQKITDPKFSPDLKTEEIIIKFGKRKWIKLV